jgi:short-subunit dehydrogenase
MASERKVAVITGASQGIGASLVEGRIVHSEHDQNRTAGELQ